MNGYYNYGWQGCATSQPCYSNYGSGGSSNVFVLIVVLFILLIIVGSVII